MPILRDRCQICKCKRTDDRFVLITLGGLTGGRRVAVWLCEACRKMVELGEKDKPKSAKVT